MGQVNIASPNYPNIYYDDSDCHWDFTTSTPGKVIKLTQLSWAVSVYWTLKKWTIFKIGLSQTETCCDELYVQESRGGAYVAGADSDGFDHPGFLDDLISAGNTMHLTWEADGSVNEVGFEVSKKSLNINLTVSIITFFFN